MRSPHSHGRTLRDIYMFRQPKSPAHPQRLLGSGRSDAGFGERSGPTQPGVRALNPRHGGDGVTPGDRVARGDGGPQHSSAPRSRRGGCGGERLCQRAERNTSESQKPQRGPAPLPKPRSEQGKLCGRADPGLFLRFKKNTDPSSPRPQLQTRLHRQPSARNRMRWFSPTKEVPNLPFLISEKQLHHHRASTELATRSS